MCSKMRSAMYRLKISVKKKSQLRRKLLRIGRRKKR